MTSNLTKYKIQNEGILGKVRVVVMKENRSCGSDVSKPTS